MKRRIFCLSAIAFFAMAAGDPPPPAPIAAYISGGRFEPGDYAWLKGRFDDASPEDRQNFASLLRWAGTCRQAAIAEMRIALEARGYPGARLDTVPAGKAICVQVTTMPQLTDYRSFATFQQDVAAAAPVGDAFLAAVKLAETSSRIDGTELRETLIARTLGEQILRQSLTNVTGPMATFPKLSPAATAIFRARMGGAIAARDAENTAWLKGIVAKSGWPTITRVGERAADAAWLLVQHADADPVFQLDALRLMEPLVARKEVSTRNYAYLYDRVMLKLAGKQRYGTQVHCVGGALAPFPLENEADLDRLRQQVGIEKEADNLASMARKIAPCPAPVGR